MIWDIRKQKKNQSQQQKEKRIQNNEGSISSLWDNFKCSDIHIIAMPKGEEKVQEIGNIYENNNEKKSLIW